MKENWKEWIGTVVEIGAMEIHDTGGLRHPRLLNVRTDKPARECTISQIR